MPSLGIGLDLPRNHLSNDFQGPLDAHTTDIAGAWSVARRLLSSYSGPLIRVRRSSDNAEMDVGYDGAGALDTAALLSFTNETSGWVSKIYDQSGFGLNLYQPTAAAQRRIVWEGNVDVMSDGTPCMLSTNFDAQGYWTDTFSEYTEAAVSLFAVASLLGAREYARVASLIPAGGRDYLTNGVLIASLGNQPKVRYEQRNIYADIVFNEKFSISAINNASASRVATNLGTQSGTSGSIQFNQVTAAGWNGQHFEVGWLDKWQAQAFYLADKTSDEAAIREALS